MRFQKNVFSHCCFALDMQDRTDYYAFGVELKGRNFKKALAKNYRFGFQGQEGDDEIKGDGNSVNYSFRMHDPRLGRFFAVDPLFAEYPANSVYAFSENDVIQHVELEGLEKAPSKSESSESKKPESKKVVGGSILDAVNKVFDDAKKATEQKIKPPAQSKESKTEPPSLKVPDLKTSEKTNTDENAPLPSGLIGPTLILLGQPIDYLKPVAALGSKKGSSIASFTLSKVVPVKITKIAGKKIGTKIASTIGTNVLGRALGRAIPGLGYALTAIDIGVAVKENPDAFYGGSSTSITGAKLGYSPSHCFVAGTEISMSNGKLERIENIVVGDSVRAFNFEKQTVENCKVLKIDAPIHDSLASIYFNYNIQNSNTLDHPYFVKSKGWCSILPNLTLRNYKFSVNQLNVGDTCYVFEGNKIIETTIYSIVKFEQRQITYNLSWIENNNNFFANKILVHNKVSPSKVEVSQKFVKVDIPHKISVTHE